MNNNEYSIVGEELEKNKLFVFKNIPRGFEFIKGTEFLIELPTPEILGELELEAKNQAVDVMGQLELDDSYSSEYITYLEKFEYSIDRVKQLYQEIIENEVKSDKNFEQHATSNKADRQGNVNNPRDVNDAESYIAKKPKITATYKRKNKKLVPINSESDRYDSNQTIVEYTRDLCESLPLAIDYSGSIYELEYGQPHVPGTSYHENVNNEHFPSTSYMANSAKGKHRKGQFECQTPRKTDKKKTKDLPRIKSATECYDFDQTDNELKDKLVKLHESLKERKFLQREVKQVEENEDNFEVEAILGVGFDEISEKLRTDWFDVLWLVGDFS
uniref:Uncharacterized protein n=1 Tax=Meloidogyne javanica TaxID=6303 RepID=A0A915M5T6_MELJA